MLNVKPVLQVKLPEAVASSGLRSIAAGGLLPSCSFLPPGSPADASLQWLPWLTRHALRLTVRMLCRPLQLALY